MDQSSVEKKVTHEHFQRHARHIQLEIVGTIPELLTRLLERTESPDIDVLLLDYRLDSLDALELLRDLRQKHRLTQPIVLVTSYGDQGVAAQALRLGASDYVVKSDGYHYQLPGKLENAYHRAQVLREQAALKASEKRFRALIENSTDGILVMNVDGCVTYTSPSILRILGYAVEEVTGRYVQQFIHPEETAGAGDFLAAMLSSPGVPHPIQMRALHKSGEWRWVEIIGVNLLNEAEVSGVVLNFRDITERRQAEERIQRQVRRLRALREIDNAITTSQELRHTLDIILADAIEQLGVHAASILLYDPDQRLFVYGAERGYIRISHLNSRVRIGEGLAGRVGLKREILRYPDPILSYENIGAQAADLAQEGIKIYYGAPLISKREMMGVLEICHRDNFSPDAEWLSFLETLAGQAAIAIDNDRMVEGLKRANVELELAYDQTLQGWIRFLDLRDMETGDHTHRLINLTEQLAVRLGVSSKELVYLRRGALLHDIGKIGVDDQILRKPGPLTDEEWRKMRQHPVMAYEMLSQIDFLRPALDIPYCHHEKWDGSGYPRGLSGEEIPLAARIFAVVDVYDALSFDRPYRQAWERQRVFEYIEFQSGIHFDPRIAHTFLEMVQSQEM
jgi:PAS domain S-box-containing protein